MPALDEVADSTDWLTTPLSGLTPIESSLRCQVCKDFFTTPMITSCSHTFCSLCIRRYLSQEGRCPACREQDQELKLRRNWTVEELVNNFVQVRDGILAFARQPPPPPPASQTVVQVDGESGRPTKRRKGEPEVNGTAGRRSTRSQSKKVAATESQASQELESTQEEVADSDAEGSVYQDDAPTQISQKQRQSSKHEPNDGLVACPNCTRRMKEAQINTHLDRCLHGLPTSPTPPPVTTIRAAQSLAFAPRTKSPIVAATKDRLPSINYALYTETSLRKKLKELGIPNHGSKELMRKRHIEWMNLWNANCDSNRPRTKRELLRDLDTWEKTLGRQLDGSKGVASGVMVKDFDRDGWAKSQKGEFDDLIARARAQRQAKAATAEAEARKAEARKEDGKLAEPMRPNGTIDGSLDSDRAWENHMNLDRLEQLPASNAKVEAAAVIDADDLLEDTRMEVQDHSVELTSSPGVPVTIVGDDQIGTPSRRSKFFE